MTVHAAVIHSDSADALHAAIAVPGIECSQTLRLRSVRGATAIVDFIAGIAGTATPSAPVRTPPTPRATPPDGPSPAFAIAALFDCADAAHAERLTAALVSIDPAGIVTPPLPFDRARSAAIDYLVSSAVPGLLTLSDPTERWVTETADAIDRLVEARRVAFDQPSRG